MHVIHLPGNDLSAPRLHVTGDEARHAARVKRIEAGDSVLVMNGRGVVVTAVVEEARRELVVRAVERREEPPVSPRVEVWSATPKGDRLGALIEGLAQTGCAEWVALETKLGVVDPGDGKLDRVARIAAEACKQSRRAWLMETGRRATLSDALDPSSRALILMLDRRGERRSGAALVPAPDRTARLLVGPEGGWSGDEIAAARHAGAHLVSIGPHVMRIETAAVVACAMVIGAG